MNPSKELEGATEPSVFRLEGVVGVQGARGLLERARGYARKAGDVIVDCTVVERLDASAIQVLLALMREVQQRGATFRLVGVPARVSALLGVTGVALPMALGDGLAPDLGSSFESDPADPGQHDAMGDSDQPFGGTDSPVAPERRPSIHPPPRESIEPLDLEALFTRPS